MNPLAFNIESSRLLRKSIQWRLAAMPYALMFGSFVPLVWLASSLEALFGDGLPMLAALLTTMVALMVSGYLLGWVLDAAVMRFVFRWPGQQVIRVFLHSEIPPAWLKANTPEEAARDTSWSTTRKMGCKNFVIRRGVLGWGAIMFGIQALGPVFSGRVQPTASYFIWRALGFAVAGAVFGLLTWYVSEKMYAKQRKASARTD